MKTLRFFRCETCGHKMRYGASRCGYCQRPARLENRYGFVVGIALALLTIVLVVLR